MSDTVLNYRHTKKHKILISALEHTTMSYPPALASDEGGGEDENCLSNQALLYNRVQPEWLRPSSSGEFIYLSFPPASRWDECIYSPETDH